VSRHKYIGNAAPVGALGPSWLTSAITRTDLRGLNGHLASTAHFAGARTGVKGDREREREREKESELSELYGAGTGHGSFEKS